MHKATAHIIIIIELLIYCIFNKSIHKWINIHTDPKIADLLSSFFPSFLYSFSSSTKTFKKDGVGQHQRWHRSFLVQKKEQKQKTI